MKVATKKKKEEKKSSKVESSHLVELEEGSLSLFS